MQLVIWDCDGVLVDSEVIVNTVFVRLLSRYGVNLSVDESLKLFTGKSAHTIYSELSKIRGVVFTEEEIEYIQSAIEDELSIKVSAVQGVKKVLNFLKKNQIDYCVASSSSIYRIQKVLVKSGLANFFQLQNIFSATMVKKGKPFPDLFLHAARSMNVSPINCLVIEDSVAGIQAAKEANMSCLAFLGASHTKQCWYYKQILKENPGVILKKMKDVECFIRKLNGFEKDV